ncbi:hypothetical protein QZH41_016448, partial [Actinostola sp. cb2023]
EHHVYITWFEMGNLHTKLKKFIDSRCEPGWIKSFQLRQPCVKSCPDGFYKSHYPATDEFVCRNISGCVDESCSECQTGLYLLKDWRTSQCVESCPVGYVGTQQSGALRCEKCIYNCAQCSDYMTCNQCMPGFSLVADYSRSYCLKRREN